MTGEDSLSLRLSNEERNRIRRFWRNSSILKLIGGSLKFSNLQIRLKRLWKIQSAFQVSDLGNGFFIARFQSPAEYYITLAGGPWFLNDCYLSVQRWVQNFRASANQLPTKIAVWIQLPELPVEYYDTLVLQQIGSLIGTSIKIDAHTSSNSRSQYARICVEVEIGKSLPKNIRIEGSSQPIGYDLKTALCLSCGQIGHKRKNYPLTPDPVTSSAKESQIPTAKTSSENDWPNLEDTTNTSLVAMSLTSVVSPHDSNHRLPPTTLDVVEILESTTASDDMIVSPAVRVYHRLI
ncbi:hypothetical protein COLO4_33809 [Corchorus olitorius]|uniref:DUF4283 domain-containing protein n=1 Tax=Corchorus olitorius TaxID=93759 RepID=A0A1R3GR55_9ROSI|nr:hypothetical protein COLO4_33809 [Corchorus olitorius]